MTLGACVGDDVGSLGDVGLDVGIRTGDNDGEDVGRVEGLDVGASVKHAPKLVLSEVAYCPPDATSTPSTDTLYDPLPYPQHKPSFAESYIVKV